MLVDSNGGLVGAAGCCEFHQGPRASMPRLTRAAYS